MIIGIIREGKNPPDKRVPLTPRHCKDLLKSYIQLKIIVQPSEHRCFSTVEYQEAGCIISEDLSSCEVLMGVKEAPIEELQSNKTYLFFSHTAKKQSYNRPLLQAVLEKNIRLVDYEYLVNEKRQRLVAFGRWAGIVGAHNGLMAWGKRTRSFNLIPAHLVKDFEHLKSQYEGTDFGCIKILVCGGGRVAGGSVETLLAAGIKRVDEESFLNAGKNEAVFHQADINQFYEHKDGREFVFQHFFDHPEEYKINFSRFAEKCDLMINAIYWDPAAPIYFEIEDLKSPNYNIRSIADITCDILGSLSTTIRPSEIADPVYGISLKTGEEIAPYSDQSLDVMAVDNLPCELPVDASRDFGNALIGEVMPGLIEKDGRGEIVARATIAANGSLGPHFAYLSAFVKGLE